MGNVRHEKSFVAHLFARRPATYDRVCLILSGRYKFYIIAATSSAFDSSLQRKRRFSNTRKYCSYSVAQCRGVYRSAVPPINRCIAGHAFTTAAPCA